MSLITNKSSGANNNFASYEAEMEAAIRASLEPAKSTTSSSTTGSLDADLQASIAEIEKIYKEQTVQRQNADKDASKPKVGKSNEEKLAASASSSSSSSAKPVDAVDPQLQKEIDAIESACAKTRLEKLLVPTVNEEWTKKKLNVVEQLAIGAFRGTSLKGVLTKNGKKLSDASWKKIMSTSIFDMKTVGDVEKLGLTFIKESEDTEKDKLHSHRELKKYLRMYVEQGLIATIKEASK